jgi:hypothetical protein
MQKTYNLHGTLNDFSRENLITQVNELPGMQGAELAKSESGSNEWTLEVTGELISDEWIEGTVESAGLVVNDDD